MRNEISCEIRDFDPTCLVTRPNVGKRFGISVGAVQRLINAGKLAPAYRIGNRVLVPESAIEAYLATALIEPVSA